MKIVLPPRTGGAPAAIAEVNAGMPLVIIGANGAGKSRFTQAIVDSLGQGVLRLNVLDGLYQCRQTGNPPVWSLRARFSQQVIAAHESHSLAPTSFELMLAQLMHDEICNLINYKLAVAEGCKSKLRRTRLDKVIEIWQEVFPDNRVLIDSGKMLFKRGRDSGDKGFSALRLSDGERAVLYYTGAVLYAPADAIIFVDSPELFLHPTLTTSLWNRLEALRSDCHFCYTTHDTEFASGRNGAQFIWVRDCDSRADTWDYELMPPGDGLSNEVYMALSGGRKPILFIEGEPRSIDAHLYPLIFPDYTVRSLGSCNKVIEATRTFNDLSSFHKMDSLGIVDRDRRSNDEVAYLRRKHIMVPEVAEVENIFIMEPVMAAMARQNGKNPAIVVSKVKKAVMNLFRAELRNQALMHTRHSVKRAMEYRVDARFDSIDAMEEYLDGFIRQLAPRHLYEQICAEFKDMLNNNDYAAILRVFNMKSMLTTCNVAPLCGYKNKEAYISGVISLLRTHSHRAEEIRSAVRNCLKVTLNQDFE